MSRMPSAESGLLARYNDAIGGSSRTLTTPPQPSGGGYESLNLYDAPDVVLSQLIGDQASWSSLVNSVLNPDKLTPEERKGLRERLFPETRNPVMQAIGNVVTNPWVWFYFATSPIGGSALRAGGSLFATSKAFSVFTKKSLGFLSQLLSPLEQFKEVGGTLTKITQMLDEESVAVRKIMANAEGEVLEELNNRIMRTHGRKGQWKEGAWMVADQYDAASPEFQELTRFQDLIAAELSGASGGRTLNVPGLKLDVYLTRREGGKNVKTLLKTGLPEDMNLGKPKIGLDGPRPDYKLVGVAREQAEAAYRMEKDSIQEARRRWEEMSSKEKLKWRHLGEEELNNLGPGESPHDFFNSFRDRFFPDKKDAREFLGFKQFWRNADETADIYLEASHDYVDEMGRSITPDVADMLKVSNMIKEYGAAGVSYKKALDQANRHVLVRSIGDEAHFTKTGTFKADEKKVYRLISSLNREFNRNGDIGMSTWEGKEAMVNMLGMEQLRTLSSISDVKKQREFLINWMSKHIETGVDWTTPNWMSRNVFQAARLADNTIPPVQLENVVQSTAMSLTPQAASWSLAGKVSPITNKEVYFHQDFLRRLESYGVLTNQGRQHLQEVTAIAEKTRREGGGVIYAWNPGRLAESVDRHFRNMHQMYAFDTAPISEVALYEDGMRIANMADDFKQNRTRHGVQGNYKVSEALVDNPKLGQKAVNQTIKDYVSHGDMLGRVYASLGAPQQDVFRNIVMPNALGNAGSEVMAVYNAHVRTKELAAWWSKSWLGNTIKKYGGKTGQNFIRRMEEIGDFNQETRLTSLSDSMAKYLYVSHLGVNVSSMLMNMTQPLLLASLVGDPVIVAKAYGRMFNEMAGYAADRARLGFKFITAEEKANLIRKHFKHADDIGVGPDMFAALDSHLAGSKGGGLDRAVELTMKGFEKTEWANRSVASHILELAYEKAGRSAADPLFRPDLKRFVLQTQFGQSDLNTPMIFQKGVFNNRLMRQFFTFPLRSATGATMVFPELGGEESRMRGVVNTFFRGMGLSAMVYEAGKGLLGVDLSPGLYAGSLTAIAGGDRMLDPEQSPLPLPPIVSIPVDMIRGFAADDARLLQSSIARLVPGGVAINRAMGFLPELPRYGVGGLPGAFQQQSVGWGQMENGLVPVYDERGALIENRSPSEIVVRALGADMGRWNQQGALDNYLVKNKPLITEMRHEYLRAAGANEWARASEIKARFEKKFGIPFTVNESQMRDYARSRVTSRTERILDMYSSEARGPYASFVAASGGVPAFDRATLAQGGTASSRDELRPGGEAAIEEMVRRIQNVGPAATQQGAFTPFSSF